ncbi:MAG: hypothetical protein IIY09_03440 [Clostridia bacterium]|nr:hypothetical protein [Clostridia bacterium]
MKGELKNGFHPFYYTKRLPFRQPLFPFFAREFLPFSKPRFADAPSHPSHKRTIRHSPPKRLLPCNRRTNVSAAVHYFVAVLSRRRA